MICEFCGKDFTEKGIGTHIWAKHTEAGKNHFKNRKDPFGDKRAWNKGKSDKKEVVEPKIRANWQNTKIKGKGSYAEIYFEKVIDSDFQDKNYVRELTVSKYRIDFAWPEKMLAIEIDGSQHEKEEHKLSDQRKDKLLLEKGWKVLRIKWSDFCKDKNFYVKLAKDFIDNVDSNYLNEIKKRKQLEGQVLLNKMLEKEKRIKQQQENDSHKLSIIKEVVDKHGIKYGLIGSISKELNTSNSQVRRLLKKFGFDIKVRR